MNQKHQQLHPGESDLDARIASYELAARMQLSAHEALHLFGLDQSTLHFQAGTRRISLVDNADAKPVEKIIA